MKTIIVGPDGRSNQLGMPDHKRLQEERPADLVGLYGGLTSTIPRLYEIARFYRGLGVPTIAGGQHFVDENIPEALENGVDIVVIGEGEETIKELIRSFDGGLRKEEITGLAYLQEGQVVKTPPRPLHDRVSSSPGPGFFLGPVRQDHPLSRGQGPRVRDGLRVLHGQRQGPVRHRPSI